MAKKQNPEEKTADMSSVIRVLNSLGANIRQDRGVIWFKTRKRSFVKDLDALAASYKPLIDLELHDCGEEYCSSYHYYSLRMHINPNIHKEAAGALYALLEKYTKK